MLNHFTGPLLVAGLAAGLTAGFSATADAAVPSKTTVTITAQGTDLSGVVRSPRPARCADGRNVVVYKQKGARGGGDDIRFASDTASLSGGVFRWSTGNTGTPGFFYAVVRAKTGCRGASSATIHAVRNP